MADPRVEDSGQIGRMHSVANNGYLAISLVEEQTCDSGLCMPNVSVCVWGNMKIAKVAAAMSGCIVLASCSTIIEGRSQQIMLNSNPSGADCGLYRQGLRIATVQNAPGVALIEKTKHDIWVACVKPGYQMASYYNKSGAAGATFGNIILGGGIGWAIDSASGADNKYASPVNITLVPNMPGQPEGPMALPASFSPTTPAPAAEPPKP